MQELTWEARRYNMKCLDISSNNHDGTVFNWQDAKAAGYDAVYIKATQNDNYVNPYLIADCKDARNAGFEVGIYHFYGSSGGSADPHSQAAWFLKNGIQQVANVTTLRAVVDVETGTAGAELEAEIEQFLSALSGDIIGTYMDRSYASIMPELDSPFLWLAWPGWTNEAVPEHTAMVQNGKVIVPGIGETNKVTDVSEIVDAVAIGMEVQPVQEDKVLAAPIVGGAVCASGGYWLVGADGGVFAFGGAEELGNLSGTKLQRPIIGMAGTASGKGYLLFGADGGVFAYGDAKEEGSLPGLGYHPVP